MRGGQGPLGHTAAGGGSPSAVGARGGGGGSPERSRQRGALDSALEALIYSTIYVNPCAGA